MRSRAMWAFVLLFCLVGLSLARPVLASPPPPLPSSFYGVVTLNGAAAPDGTHVRALIDGQAFIETSTRTWNGKAVYTLDVPGDIAGTAAREGGTEGAVVRFEVGGSLVSQTGTWSSGTNAQVDLAVSGETALSPATSTPSPTPSSTPSLTPPAQTTEIPAQQVATETPAPTATHVRRTATPTLAPQSTATLTAPAAATVPSGAPSVTPAPTALAASAADATPEPASAPTQPAGPAANSDTNAAGDAAQLAQEQPQAVAARPATATLQRSAAPASAATARPSPTPLLELARVLAGTPAPSPVAGAPVASPTTGLPRLAWLLIVSALVVTGAVGVVVFKK